MTITTEHLKALHAAIDWAVSKLGWTEETDKALAALTAALAASPAPTDYAAEFKAGLDAKENAAIAKHLSCPAPQLEAAQPALCPTCRGNDADMPCAYPSEGMTGCLRDKRLAAQPEPMPPGETFAFPLPADQGARNQQFINALAFHIGNSGFKMPIAQLNAIVEYCDWYVRQSSQQVTRNDVLEAAAQICATLAIEWASDAVVTDRNYAAHCEERIHALKTTAQQVSDHQARGQGK